MTNKYINLKRIEFFVTYHCSGRCKHCSVGDKLNTGTHHCVDAEKACEAIEKLSKLYEIESVMTFGGEPLLYADTVCKIHNCAKDCGIPKRQVITNGFFSKDADKIVHTAKALIEAGVNEILVSVDAFHQETIPLEPVHLFAKSILETGIQKIILSPAWLVDKAHPNENNSKTKEILNCFSDLAIEEGRGNKIFPAGNAAKNFSEYYEKKEPDLSISCGSMPYTRPLDDQQSISIEPNGDVTTCAFVIGNIYEQDIQTIINRYDPYDHPLMKIILDEGVEGLLQYAKMVGVDIDLSGHYSVCSVCRALIKCLSHSI